MAYGLYDQAADLISGALTLEPERQDLLAKLCEIYYVWGNRDAFIDAAMRMKAVAGGDNPDWGKIVIMGQQIAGDHEMFSGVSAGAATRAVDLSFEGAMDEASELDIDFAGGPDGMTSDVIDLGADSGDGASFEVRCDPGVLSAVRQAYETAGVKVESAEISMIAANTVQLTGEPAEKIMKLVDALEDHDDIQKVFSNFELSEADMTRLAGE